MKLPKHLQIFPGLSVLTQAQVADVSPYLSSWETLNGALMGNLFDHAQLQTLVVVELSGKARWKLLDRLLMRLGRIQRRELSDKIKSLCSKKKSRKR